MVRVLGSYSGVDAPGKYENSEGGHGDDVNTLAGEGVNRLGRGVPDRGTTTDAGRGDGTAREPSVRGATMGDVSAEHTSRPGIAEGHVASTDKLPPRAVPTRLSFRRSPLVLAGAAFFLVAAIPFAFGAPWLWLVYVLPLAFSYWILRVRTVVDAESVTARRLLSSRRVPWTEISSLRLGKKSRVSAVLTDGTELPLPTVHVRDLPVLAAVSGGRLPDPAQTEAPTSEPPSTPERT